MNNKLTKIIYVAHASKKTDITALGQTVSDQYSLSLYAEHTTDTSTSIVHTRIVTDLPIANKYAHTTTEKKNFCQPKRAVTANDQNTCIKNAFTISRQERAQNVDAKSFQNNCAEDTTCVTGEINAYVKRDPLPTKITRTTPIQTRQK